MALSFEQHAGTSSQKRPRDKKSPPMMQLGILAFSRMLLAVIDDAAHTNPALCELSLGFLREQVDQLPALSLAPSPDMQAADVSTKTLDSAAAFLVNLADRAQFSRDSVELLIGLGAARGVLTCPLSRV